MGVFYVVGVLYIVHMFNLIVIYVRFCSAFTFNVDMHGTTSQIDLLNH